MRGFGHFLGGMMIEQRVRQRQDCRISAAVVKGIMHSLCKEALPDLIHSAEEEVSPRLTQNNVIFLIASRP